MDIDEPRGELRQAAELALNGLHRLLGQADACLVALRDEAYDRMLLLPCHGFGVANDSFNGVEKGSVPVILENTPAALDRVVLAVVRRIIGEADADLMLFDEVDHAVQELAPASTVLGAVVLEKNERVDLGKTTLVLAPPVPDVVHDAVAGNLGCADRDRQFVVLGEQDAHRRGRAIGLEVMVEGPNTHTAFAVAREFADLDDRLGIARDQKLVLGLCGLCADALDLFKDCVGFRDLFLTWVFCTRTG
jgi:hypothetical protein